MIDVFLHLVDQTDVGENAAEGHHAESHENLGHHPRRGGLLHVTVLHSTHFLLLKIVHREESVD